MLRSVSNASYPVKLLIVHLEFGFSFHWTWVFAEYVARFLVGTFVGLYWELSLLGVMHDESFSNLWLDHVQEYVVVSLGDNEEAPSLDRGHINELRMLGLY
jgi:hypothetical protein